MLPEKSANWDFTNIDYAQGDILKLANPDTFVGMYQFWRCKKA